MHPTVCDSVFTHVCAFMCLHVCACAYEGTFVCMHVCTHVCSCRYEAQEQTSQFLDSRVLQPISMKPGGGGRTVERPRNGPKAGWRKEPVRTQDSHRGGRRQIQ